MVHLLIESKCVEIADDKDLIQHISQDSDNIVFLFDLGNNDIEAICSTRQNILMSNFCFIQNDCLDTSKKVYELELTKFPVYVDHINVKKVQRSMTPFFHISQDNSRENFNNYTMSNICPCPIMNKHVATSLKGLYV
jgi:hypothetical protein